MCLGIPAQIVGAAVDGVAPVEIAGVRRDVGVVLIDGGVQPGDWVLVHVGFALDRIDEEQARETLELLRQAGAAYEQEVAEIREGAR